MNTQASLLTVTRELVLEDQRLDIVERLFGMAFPLQFEPVVYGITDRMVENYNGGYWEFYTLSNGGFYMAPSECIFWPIPITDSVLNRSFILEHSDH